MLVCSLAKGILGYQQVSMYKNGNKNQYLDSLDLSSSPSICNVTLLSPFPRDFFKNAHVQTERGDIHQNETLYHSLMKGYQDYNSTFFFK